MTELMYTVCSSDDVGEHYMGKKGAKTKNKRTDGAVTKVILIVCYYI